MWLTDYLFYRIPFEIKECYKNIIGFFQRGKRGYSNRDLWSFEYYLSGIIGHGLKYLMENYAGHPTDLTDQEWIDILNKMADGFLNYYEKIFNTFEYNQEDCDKLNESLDLFKKYFYNLWD